MAQVHPGGVQDTLALTELLAVCLTLGFYRVLAALLSAHTHPHTHWD